MAESLPAPAEFVVFDEDLDAAWTERYLRAPRLAVDTEAMGLIHGRDRLCLVQIADAEDRVACVRVGLGQTDAPNLKRLFEAAAVEKVFHFARFDVAALATGLGIAVQPLFCTKVGSRLGRTYTPRHGLKDLVFELVGVELDKGAQSSATGGDRESAVACSLTCGPAVRSIGAKPAAAVRAKCTAISVVQSSIDLGHISPVRAE